MARRGSGSIKRPLLASGTAEHQAENVHEAGSLQAGGREYRLRTTAKTAPEADRSAVSGAEQGETFEANLRRGREHAARRCSELDSALEECARARRRQSLDAVTPLPQEDQGVLLGHVKVAPADDGPLLMSGER